MDNEYITTEELCRWLRVSRSTIERWRKLGMPFIKKERAVRYNKRKIQEWLESEEKSKKQGSRNHPR